MIGSVLDLIGMTILYLLIAKKIVKSGCYGVMLCGFIMFIVLDNKNILKRWTRVAKHALSIQVCCENCNILLPLSMWRAQVFKNFECMSLSSEATVKTKEIYKEMFKNLSKI